MHLCAKTKGQLQLSFLRHYSLRDFCVIAVLIQIKFYYFPPSLPPSISSMSSPNPLQLLKFMTYFSLVIVVTYIHI